MNGGRIAQMGTPPELYQNPNGRFVAEFLGESNFISAELVNLSEGTASAKLPDGTIVHGLPIDVGDPGSSTVDVLIRPEKLDVHDAAPAEIEGMNLVSGTLDMVNFLGSELEYEVRTSGGVLNARSYLRFAASKRPVGSQVFLGFSYGDCMIFAKGSRT
jgi:ABC-type Fe3+/spermidine/putrescine transport system ATPase subunit